MRRAKSNCVVNPAGSRFRWNRVVQSRTAKSSAQVLNGPFHLKHRRFEDLAATPGRRRRRLQLVVGCARQCDRGQGWSQLGLLAEKRPFDVDAELPSRCISAPGPPEIRTFRG